MKIDTALSLVFKGKKAKLEHWRNGQYIYLLHNIVSSEDGSNYRPTVTEFNSNDWNLIGELKMDTIFDNLKDEAFDRLIKLEPKTAR